jgi:hypothetical protein
MRPILSGLARIREVGEHHHEQQFVGSGMIWWPVVQWIPTECIDEEWTWLFTTIGRAWVTCIMQALDDIIVACQRFEVSWEVESM